MRVNQKAQERSIALRKQGFSLSEIKNTLGVSKSSVSLWVRAVALSAKAKESIQKKKQEGRDRASATHRGRKIKKIHVALQYGRKVNARASFNQDAFRVLCALLYWCEGEKLQKKRGTFAFTNSDPQLVAAFLHLLRTGFSVDEKKLRLMLHVHEYHDAEAQLQFWSKLTSIPLAQCHKPYLKRHTAQRIHDNYPGCVSVRYHDLDFGRRVEAIAQAFLKKGL